MDYLTPKQILIYNYLKSGPLTASEIIKRIHITKRDLRNEINDMRKKGVPVISGNFGYAIAKSRAEIEKTIRRLRSEVKDIGEIISALSSTEVYTNEHFGDN